MERTKCIRCKQRPPEPGKTNCTQCAEYKSLYSAGRRDIRKVMGKCADCGVVPVSRFATCAKCRERQSERQRKSYRRQRTKQAA